MNIQACYSVCLAPKSSCKIITYQPISIDMQFPCVNLTIQRGHLATCKAEGCINEDITEDDIFRLEQQQCIDDVKCM